MRTYRAAASAYMAFAAICAAIGCLWMVAVWRLGVPWTAVFVPVAGFCVIAIRLWLHRITLRDGILLLRLPFRRTLALNRNDILSIEFAELTGRLESPSTLCIRTAGGDEIRLDAKLFSPAAVQDLLALAARAPRA